MPPRTQATHRSTVVTTPATADSSSPGSQWFWGILGLSAMIVAFIVFLIAGLPGPTPAAEEVAVPFTFSTPELVQSEECDDQSLPKLLEGWYFELGADSIPAYDLFDWPVGTVVCQQDRVTGGVTSLEVKYQATEDSISNMLEYVQWLRDYSGFIPGPIKRTTDSLTGELWRPSVSIGAIIHLQYSVQPSGTVVRITKDLTGDSLSGLYQNRMTSPSPSVGMTPKLSLEIPSGWDQYTTWEEPFKGVTPNSAMAFAKTVESDIVATFMVIDISLTKSPCPDSLEMFANVGLTDFHPQEPFIRPDTVSFATIDGHPALSHTLQWEDTEFRFIYTVIQDRGFAIISMVRPAAVPNPAADIEAMLSSITITE